MPLNTAVRNQIVAGQVQYRHDESQADVRIQKPQLAVHLENRIDQRDGRQRNREHKQQNTVLNRILIRFVGGHTARRNADHNRDNRDHS